MNHRLVFSALAVHLCLVTSVAQAVTCEANIAPSNPDSAYTDHGNGTVTHEPTGLTWKVCSEGQIWKDGSCLGTASSYTWTQALTLAGSASFGGQGDWRLPNIKELRSLIEECRVNPAINDWVFPATYGSGVWSGSPSFENSYYAWYAHFLDGSSSDFYKAFVNNVRLVRGGQSFDSFGVAIPACNLSASPASISAASTSTLTAQCNPAATSYAWTGGTCAGTTAATCTVTPSATTSYSVAGINSAGKGTPASATVTVAAGPTFTLNPSALSFAAQAVGSSSAAQNITLSNSGTAVLNIASIVANGDFARTTTCGATLAQAAYCTISVMFIPTSASVQISSLLITSNAASSPNMVSLSGTGTSSGATCGKLPSPAPVGGIDTVVYQCQRSSYTLTKVGTGWQVTSASNGINDVLPTGVDRIQFADITVALDISGNAGQVYRLYQAAFNRMPDKGGLGDWIFGMDHGMSLLEVSAGFVNSSEFKTVYGQNPTDSEVVTRFYNNVLHRAPEQAGYDYWINQLQSKLQTRTQVLTGFSESPENQAQVIGVIQNGIEYTEHKP